MTLLGRLAQDGNGWRPPRLNMTGLTSACTAFQITQLGHLRHTLELQQAVNGSVARSCYP